MASEREAALEERNRQLEAENRLLREKVDLLIGKVFGISSEALDPNQLMLLEAESKKAEAPAAASAGDGSRKAARATKPRRPRIPEHLPIEEEVLEPDEVKSNPHRWRKMGEEVSEQLDYRPGKFIRRRLIRPKYVRHDQPYAPPVIAPLPPGLQERCLATSELVTHVVISKYVDHLPLYRQETIYRQRYGVELPRQTLCRWVELAAYWLKPLYHQIAQEQFSSPYLQIDETPIRYLKPGTGKAQQGYFWTSSVPGADVVYHWHPGRSTACLEKIIPPEFTGILQCDGYRAYQSFQKQRAGPIELAGCWAHARRKFFEAQERDPRVAGWILNQIGALYHIESRLRDQRAGPQLRAAVRAAESRPILQRLHRLLVKLQSRRRFLPQSLMGKAINYTLDQWPRLEVFTSNGLIEIDNNLVENAIRPTKLGHKNWLFFGSEASGETSAILFSLIESAKRRGLDPHQYIGHLLRTLPHSTNHQIPDLTPAAYARSLKLIAA